MPVALASMVVMITVGPRMAALTAFITSVFHATMQNSGIDALSISLSSSLIGVYFCRGVRLRGSVLKAGAMAGLIGAILAIGVGMAVGSGAVALANHAVASLVVGVLTGALVLGALPIIEYSFKVATDATLFELTDFNHPLLRRMQVEAPGTYHHSLMVANLAENAALSVGANPTMCRACSLFHDIGKGLENDHTIEGEKIATKLSKRFTLKDSEREKISWLVRNHLLMSDFAQKRDLSDQKTIVDFQEYVQDRETLDLLFILTVCDIRGVSADAWNNWKSSLLESLYFQSEHKDTSSMLMHVICWSQILKKVREDCEIFIPYTGYRNISIKLITSIPL